MFFTAAPEKTFKPVALFEMVHDGRKMQLGSFDTVEEAIDMLFYRKRDYFYIEADADNADCFDGLAIGPTGALQFAIEPNKF